MRRFGSNTFILLICISLAWISTSFVGSVASIIKCDVSIKDGIPDVKCNPACKEKDFCHYYGKWDDKHYCTCVIGTTITNKCNVVKDGNNINVTCNPKCPAKKYCQYYGKWDGIEHCSCLEYGPARPCTLVDENIGKCTPACPGGSSCIPYGELNGKTYCYCDNLPYSN